jgi:hypothetical protein
MRLVKIEFKNCNMEYDYTICPWSEIEDQISNAEMDLTDTLPEDYEDFMPPTIVITPCLMTDEEFTVWFTQNVENDA